MKKKLISIIVPVFNEEENIPEVGKVLRNFIDSHCRYDYEIILVNDGSTDRSLAEMGKLLKDSHFKLIDFSRNFGKELAVTAGINYCKGDACIVFDADMQYPIEKIGDFLKKWEEGSEVVIGIREKNNDEGLIKKLGSAIFYRGMEILSKGSVIPRATDFTLIDRKVIDVFNTIDERERNTRSLINWLGFDREYVYFEANARENGKSSYSVSKLVKLALDSVVSFSMLPLKLAGIIGTFITLLSGTFGLAFLIGKYIFDIAWFKSITGTGQLAVLTIFLIGVVLVCLGLIALYIGKIHGELDKRPLYVVRYKN